MINAPILPGILYAHDISYALHHTDDIAFSRAVGTDGADILVRYHTALAAIPDLISQIYHSLSKMMDILRMTVRVQDDRYTPFNFQYRSPYTAAATYARYRTAIHHIF